MSLSYCQPLVTRQARGEAVGLKDSVKKDRRGDTSTMMAEAERRKEAINRLVGWCKAQDPSGFQIAGE